ncbi:MAG: Asp-tRNA(Asn)/Glu-tRNA(Gln) amidotransferase subunit GatA [Candidatus Lokiarchaeota archaeon]|nr:Asp-tRNA(Asn)/Glu-tRNA(Gln) amidotransferase subunit GatA [Candidatus Lokiarchaeota archaeon]
MKLYEYMAYELLEKIKNREITIEEVIQQVYERIEETEDKLHSFVHLSKEKAINKAQKLDKKIKNGKPIGKLYGLPIGIKDLICIKDSPTTCGSKILQNYIPPYNATVIENLIEKEGAICVGRTNMDEFAMGSSTENSSYGPTYNPWNLDHVPGGSSGGSGACVASGQTPVSLGSDTGGSIRCPASYCGVVGLKPTYGRVSRYGLISYANSLDQIGPLSRCVYDTALLLEIIAGHDPLDSTTVDTKVDNYTEILQNPIENVTLGVPKEFFIEGLEKNVKDKVNEAIERLCSLGAKKVEISFPHLEYAIATYYLIAMSEASSNLARYDGLRYGEMSDDLNGDVYEVFSRTRNEKFGAEVRRRIILGSYTLSAGYYDMFYMKALKVRSLIKDDFQNAFKHCDVIVSPTMPTTAFKIGELLDNPLQMYLMDILTCPVNLAGLPALSIPCGFDENNLPIGFQIIGDFFDEKTILNVGNTLEQKLNIYRKLAPLQDRGN